jgi:chaperone required for assembly of F1-ATPase
VKRIYKRVEVARAAETGRWRVLLDGRPVRSPAKTVLEAPGRALAEAVAAEWAAQGDTVRPATMPLTQLLNTALDRVPGERRAIAAEIVRFAETDLVLHRAAGEPALAARQAAAWDPILDWLEERHRARLVPTSGLAARPQSGAALARIADAVADLDDCALAALHFAAGALGSAALALALLGGRLDAEAAFAAAFLEDLDQLARWGRDAEAVARLEAIKADIAAAARFAALAAED